MSGKKNKCVYLVWRMCKINRCVTFSGIWCVQAKPRNYITSQKWNPHPPQTGKDRGCIEGSFSPSCKGGVCLCVCPCAQLHQSYQDITGRKKWGWSEIIHCKFDGDVPWIKHETASLFSLSSGGAVSIMTTSIPLPLAAVPHTYLRWTRWLLWKNWKGKLLRQEAAICVCMGDI